VWLMRTQRGVTRGVWRLVCLVALSAMDYGRRLAARRILEGQRSLQPGPQLALQVQRAAVARFWGILSEFCALGGAPYFTSGSSGFIIGDAFNVRVTGVARYPAGASG